MSPISPSVQWQRATQAVAANLDEEKVAHRDAYMAAIAHALSLRQVGTRRGGFGGGEV